MNIGKEGMPKMGRVREFILNELGIIEKECPEKGITASEWVKRYAEGYARRNGNGRHARGKHA